MKLCCQVQIIFELFCEVCRLDLLSENFQFNGWIGYFHIFHNVIQHVDIISLTPDTANKKFITMKKKKLQ